MLQGNCLGAYTHRSKSKDATPPQRIGHGPHVTCWSHAIVKRHAVLDLNTQCAGVVFWEGDATKHFSKKKNVFQ